MELTPNMIYWITRLDTIKNGLSGVLILLVVAWMLLTIAILLDEFISDEKRRKRAILIDMIITIALVFLLFLNIFTPTSRDVLLMYGVPRTVESKIVKDKEMLGEFLEWRKEK